LAQGVLVMQRFCFQQLLKLRGSLTGSKSYDKQIYYITTEKEWHLYFT
jgi:hypothetical protein